MTVAPIPVIPLRSAGLFGIHAIRPVLFHQVTAVGMVLAVIPVMVILMIPIVDSDLNADLRARGSHECHWRHKYSGQEYRSDITICTVHVVILQDRDFRFRNRGSHDYEPKASDFLSGKA